MCQAGEIADAQWFTRDSLPQTPPKTAISGWLIEEFVKSLPKDFYLKQCRV